jgi:formylglycine-generating enzyme required for sulfatase activity
LFNSFFIFHFSEQLIMLLKKILISAVILLAACNSPEGQQETPIKGPQSAETPPPAVVPEENSSSSSLRRLALVIGNSAYAGDNFLTNPVNDAKALAKVLRQPELNFEVISKTNLNRKQMKAAIREFSKRLSEEQGVGLFYFSGHGLQYQGINYLIPIGAQQALQAAYDLPEETVKMDYVLNAMKTVENKINILILDACRNPPRFVKNWYKGDMIPPGLALPQRTPGASLIAYAAAPGQVALSGEGQGNSPYVKSLMKWIQVPNLSITDALIQVRNEVIETTYQMQEPEFSVALNKPFYFNPQAKTEPTEPEYQAEQQRLAKEKAKLQRQQAELQAEQAAEQQRLAQEKAQLQAERDRLAQEREAMQREQARLQAQAQARLAQEREALKQEQAKLQAEQERLARQQQAMPDTYRLTVLATPADSQIKIMNIVPRYVPGIALKPGKYDVLVQKPGYIASRQWITIQDQDVSLPVVLEKFAKIFRDRLKDGSLGPEMVWIKGGSFRMGDIQGGGDSDEKPVHSVSVRRFAMGRYEVTVGEYLRFVRATGRHAPEWQEAGSKYNIQTGTDNYYKKFGSALTNENHPIVGISWDDATAYAKWLSRQTGHTYRLPTEAQWEYAARAGTTTKYWWGNHIGSNKANCSSSCGDKFKYTAPVGSFSPNPFGLYDTVGNVWEWTCSEYENRYNGKESKCIRQNSGSLRALRGGAWNNGPRDVRAATRGRMSHDNRDNNVGLRLSRL